MRERDSRRKRNEQKNWSSSTPTKSLPHQSHYVRMPLRGMPLPRNAIVSARKPLPTLRNEMNKSRTKFVQWLALACSLPCLAPAFLHQMGARRSGDDITHL
jgi:hypothetical protein